MVDPPFLHKPCIGGVISIERTDGGSLLRQCNNLADLAVAARFTVLLRATLASIERRILTDTRPVHRYREEAL